MRWVAFIDVWGLYTAAHPGSPADTHLPHAVIRDGVAIDGCVLARQHGLQAGMPVWQVRRQIPGVELLDWAATDYTPVQQAFWDACAVFTPWVEPVGGHQIFLSLPAQSGPPRPEVEQILAQVRAAITRRTARPGAPGASPPGTGTISSLEFSTGLAANKLVARAAASQGSNRGRRFRQPAGIAVIQPGTEADFLAPLPVSALWRASAGLQARFARLGVTRVAELAQLSAAELTRQFGAEGSLLQRWTRGEDPEPVRAAYPPRCLEATVPLPDGTSLAGLPVFANQAARALAVQLDQAQANCQRLELSLRLAGRDDVVLSRSLPRPRHGAFVLEQQVSGLLTGFLSSGLGKAQPLAVTARARELSPVEWQQVNLWGQEAVQDVEREAKLEQALMALAARFPAGSARVGWGPAEQQSRREAMLAFYDPYRWPLRGADLN